MEKINRHNYEAYLLDYLEGNLGTEEQHDLLVFLAENPDLKEAIDFDLPSITLSPDKDVFENKADLKMHDESTLSLNTVEYWMIDAVEGNLSTDKQQELDEFIRKHQLEKTFTTYQATLLKADLNVVFADKKSLKVATGIIIPLYARIASVAAIGLVLLTLGYNLLSDDTTGNSVNPGGEMSAKSFQNNKLNFTENEIEKRTNLTQQSTEKSNQTERRKNKTPDINNQIVEQNIEQSDTGNTKLNIETNQPENNFANQDNQQDEKENPEEKLDIIDVAQAGTVTNKYVIEEPFKVVTNAASNFTNRDINFTREKNTETNEYVSYGVKIGNFEFERKKTK
ncbi:MAG: hypothetical protein IPM74_17675 [Crocinitomicaceae bacterium]|nr:hypothetical protein [Crocinitomicaceae bacterium]